MNDAKFLFRVLTYPRESDAFTMHPTVDCWHVGLIVDDLSFNKYSYIFSCVKWFLQARDFCELYNLDASKYWQIYGGITAEVHANDGNGYSKVSIHNFQISDVEYAEVPSAKGLLGVAK